ncbi:MAG: DUF2155 domain-containing protein [Caulobacter sp.]|nr:DUF2155 domain-containing protein [Caulobacter sp.]
MRLKRSLLALLVLAGTAGLVQAQQATPPVVANSPPPVESPPASPVREEPPPAPITLPPPAPIVAETPVVAPASPKPTVVEKPAEPIRRTRSGAAIIQALDKVTAETLRFEAPIGQPVRYKSLVFTVKACESSAPDETAPEAAAYLVIDSQPKSLTGRAPPPPRQVFRGWMFAASPGLNPLQHPVYDAWVIACRASAPEPSKR